MTTSEIAALERQIFELNAKLQGLLKTETGNEVKNYGFRTTAGETSLRDLFGDDEQLLVIHNMGQGCRYCTLWADGINGLLPHLESAMGVVLVSKDAPSVQRRFANSRGWRFRLASHGGGDYIAEQSVQAGDNNVPGAVVYELRDDVIHRKNTCVFGPGDRFCVAWNFLGMAGRDVSDWTPQFRYWQRPRELDDGGQNIAD